MAIRARFAAAFGAPAPAPGFFFCFFGGFPRLFPSDANKAAAAAFAFAVALAKDLFSSSKCLITSSFFAFSSASILGAFFIVFSNKSLINASPFCINSLGVILSSSEDATGVRKIPRRFNRCTTVAMFSSNSLTGIFIEVAI